MKNNENPESTANTTEVNTDSIPVAQSEDTVPAEYFLNRSEEDSLIVPLGAKNQSELFTCLDNFVKTELGPVYDFSPEKIQALRALNFVVKNRLYREVLKEDGTLLYPTVDDYYRPRGLGDRKNAHRILGAERCHTKLVSEKGPIPKRISALFPLIPLLKDSKKFSEAVEILKVNDSFTGKAAKAAVDKVEKRTRPEQRTWAQKKADILKLLAELEELISDESEVMIVVGKIKAVLIPRPFAKVATVVIDKNENSENEGNGAEQILEPTRDLPAVGVGTVPEENAVDVARTETASNDSAHQTDSIPKTEYEADGPTAAYTLPAYIKVEDIGPNILKLRVCGCGTATPYRTLILKNIGFIYSGTDWEFSATDGNGDASWDDLLTQTAATLAEADNNNSPAA